MASSSCNRSSPIWSKKTQPSAPPWMKSLLALLRSEASSALGNFARDWRATLRSGPSRHGGPSLIGTVPQAMSSLARHLFLSPNDHSNTLLLLIVLCFHVIVHSVPPAMQAPDIPIALSVSSLFTLVVLLLSYYSYCEIKMTCAISCPETEIGKLAGLCSGRVFVSRSQSTLSNKPFWAPLHEKSVPSQKLWDPCSCSIMEPGAKPAIYVE